LVTTGELHTARQMTKHKQKFAMVPKRRLSPTYLLHFFYFVLQAIHHFVCWRFPLMYRKTRHKLSKSWMLHSWMQEPFKESSPDLWGPIYMTYLLQL